MLKIEIIAYVLVKNSCVESNFSRESEFLSKFVDNCVHACMHVYMYACMWIYSFCQLFDNMVFEVGKYEISWKLTKLM